MCRARREGARYGPARAPPETPKMSNAGSAEGWAASLLVCGSVRSRRSSAPSRLPVAVRASPPGRAGARPSTVAPFRRALPVEPRAPESVAVTIDAPPLRGVAVARADRVRPSGLVAGTTSTSSAGPALAGFIGMAVALRRAAPAGHSGRQALVRGGGARGRALPRAAREPGNQCRTNHRMVSNVRNQEPVPDKPPREPGTRGTSAGNQCRTTPNGFGWFRARRRSSGRTWEPVPDKPPNGFEWFRARRRSSGRTRDEADCRWSVSAAANCRRRLRRCPQQAQLVFTTSRGGNEHACVCFAPSSAEADASMSTV